MINGSPDISGCIHTAMMIAKEQLEKHGVGCGEFIVGNRDIRGCIGCRKCKTTVPSTYWNDVHGYHKEDIFADEEGVETIQNMAENMVFLMQCMKDGKAAYGLPETPHAHFTNFIR